ncbi:MAG: hypothetical protein AAF432_16885 [Planctomycetota bacterium]
MTTILVAIVASIAVDSVYFLFAKVVASEGKALTAFFVPALVVSFCIVATPFVALTTQSIARLHSMKAHVLVWALALAQSMVASRIVFTQVFSEMSLY